MKNVHIVKVKPQPKRKEPNVLYVFNINWNIFKWWSTVNPEEQDNDTAEQDQDEDIAEDEEEPENGIELNLDIVWDEVLPY